MFSGDLLRKYLRYFILIVSIIVVVMGFLWLNFLYTRHKRDLSFTEETYALALEEEAQDKALQLRTNAEELKAKEKMALEDLLDLEAGLLKASIYDIYFSDKSLEHMKGDFERVTENLSQSSKLQIHLLSDDFDIGQPPQVSAEPVQGTSETDGLLIHYGYMPSPDLHYWIYVDLESYINERIEATFIDFAQWDESMYLKDSRGRLVLPIAGQHSEEGFYSEVYSEDTGYTYGYFISKSDLSHVIDGRKELFESFLRSHIWEIVGFLVIFSITSFVIYRRGLTQLEGYYLRLNDEILEAYRQDLSLSHNPDFQFFALGDSFDSILRESKLKSQDYEERIKDLSQELKKNKLERLLLERKISRLSELPFTKEILYNYTVESFSPREKIEEIHSRIDPEASLEITGSEGRINNDVGLFVGLVEEVFELTSHEGHSYTVRIVRDGAQMLIYFTLEGMDGIPDDKMQELKNRAKLLDGVFLRHQAESHILHLVLSLNDLRNEEI